MIVRMYHSDHNPPHFHAQYGDLEAIMEIGTGKILHGRLPARLRRLLREWTKLRRRELDRAWKEAQAHRLPGRIKPIE